MSRSDFSTATIYRWPIVIALVSIVGLLSALFGDGGWDALSWLLLAIPLAFIAKSVTVKNR